MSLLSGIKTNMNDKMNLKSNPPGFKISYILYVRPHLY